MKNHALGARQALLDAFAELALTRRYQEFGTGLIAVRANVGRSTFYYHFKAKDDLSVQNLMPMISALARLPSRTRPPLNCVTGLRTSGKIGRTRVEYSMDRPERSFQALSPPNW